MIKSKPYYWITCDKCDKRCDYYEHSAWAEEWTAVEYAEADDWITHGDKHFCPDCQVVCEDREIRCAPPDANTKCGKCAEVSS